jgi:hypothetical protein
MAARPFVVAVTRVLTKTTLRKVARMPQKATTSFTRKHEIKINFH